MTQALALRRLLAEAGHSVCGVVMGRSDRRKVPDFVREKLSAPVSFVQSPNFVTDCDERTVRPLATAIQGLCDAGTLYRELGRLRDTIEAHDPDVVVNFFEPMAGWTYLRHAPSPPLVCVAHQYMFLHPSYAFPPGRRFSRWMARAFAMSTAWRADRLLALSLYPVETMRTEALGHDLAVMPPLLRDELFEQPLDRTEPFLLVYIVNRGYAEQVIRWHEQHPEVRLHCFWDRPGSETVEAYDDTLTFHQLDGEKFLSMMARCRGLVSTAGFESVAEAMYLGKPVQVVPVEGHFEQWCNAFDTVRAGAGVRSRRFNLSTLQDHVAAAPVEETAAFRAWLRRSRDRFVREVEAAAGDRRSATTDRVSVSADASANATTSIA